MLSLICPLQLGLRLSEIISYSDIDYFLYSIPCLPNIWFANNIITNEQFPCAGMLVYEWICMSSCYILMSYTLQYLGESFWFYLSLSWYLMGRRYAVFVSVEPNKFGAICFALVSDVILSKYHRNWHRNLWDRQCVSSWWPLDCFGYLDELYIDIWFTFENLTNGVCHLLYLYWLMGKGVAYGSMPFPGTGCPVPDVANIYLIWNN